jgi:ribosomal protein L12E/L44/L45/RPP1/RPP2
VAQSIPAPVEIGVPVTQAYQGMATGLQGTPITSVYRQALDKGVPAQQLVAAGAAEAAAEHRGASESEEPEGEEETEETEEGEEERRRK